MPEQPAANPELPAAKPEASLTPQSESLQPWNIDLHKITEKQELERIDKVLEEWIGKMREEVSAILAKNGITMYQVIFIHPGSKQPMHFNTLNNYTAAKLVKLVHAELANRACEDMGVNLR